MSITVDILAQMIFLCNAVWGDDIVHFSIQNMESEELLIFSKESLSFSKVYCNTLKDDYTKVYAKFERKYYESKRLL